MLNTEPNDGNSFRLVEMGSKLKLNSGSYTNATLVFFAPNTEPSDI